MTTNATVTATSMMMRRARSSPRCSTRVASSPWLRRRGSRGTALGRGGVVLARGCRRSRLRRLRQLRSGLVVLAGDGVLELPHPAPERAADLGQPLRPEDEQRDDEDDDQTGDSDLRHASRVALPGTNGQMRKKPLAEQVVIVTGSSSGLGRAIARGAGERGAKVVV